MVDEDRERAIAEMPFAQWAEAKPDRTIAFVQSSAQSTSSCMDHGRLPPSFRRAIFGLCTFTDIQVWHSFPGADPEHTVDGARPILFTHVPLYRPERTDCGPLRERGTIRQGRGLGYQNLLSQSASQFLLQTIRPAIVFRCVHNHPVALHRALKHLPVGMTTTTASTYTQCYQLTPSVHPLRLPYPRSRSSRSPWLWAFGDQATSSYR